MKALPTPGRNRGRVKTTVVVASTLCIAYLLSVGPFSRLKTSGAVDWIPGGCQAIDVYCYTGVAVLQVPGLGAAYAAYLRWWDDLDEPG